MTVKIIAMTGSSMVLIKGLTLVLAPWVLEPHAMQPQQPFLSLRSASFLRVTMKVLLLSFLDLILCLLDLGTSLSAKC
jgi:hypothetical protein